jgi:hypothetical protein
MFLQNVETLCINPDEYNVSKLQIHTYVCTHICMYAHMYVCMYLPTHAYLCIYIYIHVRAPGHMQTRAWKAGSQ